MGGKLLTITDLVADGSITTLRITITTGLIGIVAAVVAAIFDIIGDWNSKPVLLRRIDRKEKQLWNIEQEIFRPNGACNQHHPRAKIALDLKKKKLLQQIEQFKRCL